MCRDAVAGAIASAVALARLRVILTRMRWLVSVGLGALLLIAASTARAEEAAAQAPDHGRLRVGFNVNGGVGIGDGTAGPLYGATFRLGWQINRKMAAFAQGAMFGWFTPERRSGGTTASNALGVQGAALFAYLPSDAFELALGPSLDHLLTMNSSTVLLEDYDRAGRRITYGQSSLYFALHGRAALHVGGQPDAETGRRSGFTVGLDLHPTFIGRSTILFASAGVGADWY